MVIITYKSNNYIKLKILVNNYYNLFQTISPQVIEGYHMLCYYKLCPRLFQVILL
jgi:hypothetical protein